MPASSRPQEPAVGRYGRYKAATSRVFAWLKSASGHHIRTTHDVLEALRSVIARDPPAVPSKEVMSELDMSIRLREETTRVLGTPDAGHTFFLNLLRECRRRLRSLVVVPAQSASAADGGTADAKIPAEIDDGVVDLELSNQFSALSTLASDQAEEVDCHVASVFEDGNTDAAPSPPAHDAAEAAARVRLDVFEGAFFLLDMDELMQDVVAIWGEVKAGTATTMVATAVTNAAVQLLTRMAAELELHYPHLCSLSAILTTVNLQPIINYVMDEHPSIDYPRAVATVSAARGLNLANNERMMTSFQNISRIGGISMDDAIQLCLHMVTAVQELEEGGVYGWSNLFGGESSIRENEAMYVELLRVIRKETRLMAKPGFFGPEWVPGGRRASSCGDLRCFLMDDVLPSLLVMTISPNAVFRIEHQDATMPLLELVRTYFDSKGVSIAFSFALHALLHAVIVTQAKNGSLFRRICEQSRATLRRSFEHAKQLESSILPLSEALNLRNVEIVRSWLELHVKSTLGTRDEAQLLRGMYNPYMAGQYMLTLSYAVSLTAGASVFLDCFGQLRMTLHLYNALRLTQVLAEPIALLDQLLQLTATCAAVWPAGKPGEPGQFLTAFMLAWGYSAKSARDYAPRIRTLVDGDLSRSQASQLMRSTARANESIDAKQICSSFAVVTSNDYVEAAKHASDAGNRSNLAMARWILMAVRECVEADAAIARLDFVALAKILLHVQDCLTGALGLGKCTINELGEKLRLHSCIDSLPVRLVSPHKQDSAGPPQSSAPSGPPQPKPIFTNDRAGRRARQKYEHKQQQKQQKQQKQQERNQFDRAWINSNENASMHLRVFLLQQVLAVCDLHSAQRPAGQDEAARRTAEALKRYFGELQESSYILFDELL